ncbi:MAG: DctP family TRAP transporter solute-binding subunit [Planctomycetota bacterium]|jgi:tripartite ATP-independent transporter DctP family solute receptor|nr:DctP family TRAP transporter solute-binding subunit [Planctomycetota bacterium]
MRKLLLTALCLAAAGAGIRAADGIVIKVGNETARTDSQFVGIQAMADRMRQKAGDRVAMELYPASEKGGPQEMVEMVKSGSGDLDIYVGGAGFFANWDGRLSVFDIPYLFDSAPQAHKILDGAFGDEMLAALEPFGVKGLAFYENGVRSITNNKRPIRTPDDVKGLELRVMPGNPVHVKIWTMFGANPHPVPFKDIYENLKTGKLDGQEHPIAPIYSGKFYEVQKHLSLTRHIYGPLIMVMNKPKFDGLPADLREILVAAARFGAQAQRKFIADNEAKFIEDMKKAGMEIIEVDAKPFRDKVRPTIEKDFVDKNGDAWLKRIESMK